MSALSDELKEEIRKKRMPAKISQEDVDRMAEDARQNLLDKLLTTPMRIIMHGHHAEQLFSFLPSLEKRLADIHAHKAKEEWALREALIQDVTDLLPKNAAWEAYETAWEAFVAVHDTRPSRVAFVAAWGAFMAAWAAYFKSFDVEAFHREHCHPRCPWTRHSIDNKGWAITALAEVGSLGLVPKEASR